MFLLKRIWRFIRNRCISCNSIKSKYNEQDIYTWKRAYCRACNKTAIHALMYGGRSNRGFR